VLEKGADRFAVGLGMIPRGEVGLIFAGIGTSLTLQGQPVLAQGVFSAIVLMVLVTTLLAPLGLRWAFRRSGRVSPGPAQHGERDEGGTAGERAKLSP
jgi:Kef-type K+ transport system membrane component KefB